MPFLTKAFVLCNTVYFAPIWSQELYNLMFIHYKDAVGYTGSDKLHTESPESSVNQILLLCDVTKMYLDVLIYAVYCICFDFSRKTFTTSIHVVHMYFTQ